MNDTGEQGFSNAELHRRFGNLLLRGHVSTKQNDLPVITVNTAAGDLHSPPLPVIGRDPARVTIGESCLVICPRGELAQGLVVMLGEDPLLVGLQKQMAALTTT